MSRRKFMMSDKRRRELKQRENEKRNEDLEAYAKALNTALGGKRRRFVPREIVRGDYNPPKPTGRAAERSTEPSLKTNACFTGKKEKPKYTGDKVIGVALMHKSSYVPVVSQDEAVSVTRMRRG